MFVSRQCCHETVSDTKSLPAAGDNIPEVAEVKISGAPLVQDAVRNPSTLGSMQGKAAGALPPELPLKWYLLREGMKRECSERCQALQASLERLIHWYYLLAFE